MKREKIPRILVARTGLDEQDSGTMVLAMVLRNAGFEVIYTGGNQNPEQIVSSAIQEDVDMIGLSMLADAHAFSYEQIRRLLKENGAGDIMVIRSGDFSLTDISRLKQMGTEYHALRMAS